MFFLGTLNLALQEPGGLGQPVHSRTCKRSVSKTDHPSEISVLKGGHLYQTWFLRKRYWCPPSVPVMGRWHEFALGRRR
jgi:hypothetical protein